MYVLSYLFGINFGKFRGNAKNILAGWYAADAIGGPVSADRDFRRSGAAKKSFFGDADHVYPHVPRPAQEAGSCCNSLMSSILCPAFCCCR
jgi:hypothetical protein